MGKDKHGNEKGHCNHRVAKAEDLHEILQLQYLAFQSEADLFGTRDIPPLNSEKTE